MGKDYELVITTKGIPAQHLEQIVCGTFGWHKESFEQHEPDIVSLTTTGSMSSSKSEQDSHTEIYQTLKQQYPQAFIKTRYYLLEDPPYEEFGDTEKLEEYP